MKTVFKLLLKVTVCFFVFILGVATGMEAHAQSLKESEPSKDKDDEKSQQEEKETEAVDGNNDAVNE